MQRGECVWCSRGSSVAQSCWMSVGYSTLHRTDTFSPVETHSKSWLLLGKCSFSANAWRILPGGIAGRSAVFFIQSSVCSRVMGRTEAHPKALPSAGMHLELVASSSESNPVRIQVSPYFWLYMLLFLFRMELECQWNVNWKWNDPWNPPALCCICNIVITVVIFFSRISFTES